jgi:hypothetical protein
MRKAEGRLISSAKLVSRCSEYVEHRKNSRLGVHAVELECGTNEILSADPDELLS